MGDVDASDRSGRLSSVVFPEDCEFFDEIDDLYPYSNEDDDDELVADPTLFNLPRPSCSFRYTRISLHIKKDDFMPPVDWSSLLKSCRLAKNGFRDSYSEQMVVTNMFMSNLAPLTAALSSYAINCCCNQTNSNESFQSLNEIKACATEAKRALRFAISCLTPTSFEVNGAGQEPVQNSSHTLNGEVIYNITRPYRQNLQMVAVGGSISELYPSTGDDETNQQWEVHHHDLHILLVTIIFADRPCHSFLGEQSLASESSEDAEILISIEEEHRKVRVLAARLLCNIVTDNHLAAGIMLRDLPLSPALDLVENRIAVSVIGSTVNNEIVDDDMIFWSDLVNATAKVGAGNTKRDGKSSFSYGHQSEDREALAAVAAALHNLLTSLEGSSSFAEQHREAPLRVGASNGNSSEDKVERRPMVPSNMAFEIASDGILLNSLLRHILPAKSVLQSHIEREGANPSRPKFIPPVSTEEENISDSATEWISFILERLASRGLFLNMLRSVGGKKSNAVTPEQVVLVSCIRQAVDDYHHALTSTSETKQTVQRRSSSGIKMSTSAHPLWGRADAGANQASYSRIAVPVLLSLANEIEGFRLKLNSLRQDRSLAMYDGEDDCTTHIIDDLSDILAQSLGDYDALTSIGKEDFIADARSVLGRETSLISSCCKELGRILDVALARNAGRKAREMQLDSQEQRTAIMSVRLLANIIYQCRYNQDLLRMTPVPVLDVEMANTNWASSNAAQSTNDIPTERTGLHVLLSATTLAPACFTLREWCIVAIRNAVEENAANTETIRSLEANQALNDTPELRRMGIKIDIDAKGKVHMSRGSQSSYPQDSDQVSWA